MVYPPQGNSPQYSPYDHQNYQSSSVEGEQRAYSSYQSAEQSKRPFSGAVAVAALLQLALAVAIVMQTIGVWKYTGAALENFVASIEQRIHLVAEQFVEEEAAKMGISEEEARQYMREELAEFESEALVADFLSDLGLESTDQLNPPVIATLPSFIVAALLILAALLVLGRQGGGRIVSFILHPFLIIGCGAVSAGLLALPYMLKHAAGSELATSDPRERLVYGEMLAVFDDFYSAYPGWFEPALYATALLSTLGSIVIIILLATRGAKRHCQPLAVQQPPQPMPRQYGGY